MSRNYVDNALNRRVGRVGMPIGSAVISKNTVEGFNIRTYADNDENWSLERVGLPHGSAVQSKYCSGLTQWHYLDERLPRTHKQENSNGRFVIGDIYPPGNTWKMMDDAFHWGLLSSDSLLAQSSSDESSSLVGHKPDIYNQQAWAESRHTKSSGERSIENLPDKLERQLEENATLLAQKKSLEEECEKLKEELTRMKIVSKADKEHAVVSLRKENTTLRGKLERQREKNAVLHDQKDSLHDQCKKLSRMILVAKEDKKHAVVSLRELNTTLESKLERQCEENAALLAQKKSLGEEFKNLKEVLTRMKKNSKEDKEHAVVSLREQNRTLRGVLQERAETIATLSRERSHYKQQCKAMKDQLRNLSERVIPEKDGNIISPGQQITALQKKHDGMMRSVRPLESLPASSYSRLS